MDTLEPLTSEEAEQAVLERDAYFKRYAVESKLRMEQATHTLRRPEERKVLAEKVLRAARLVESAETDSDFAVSLGTLINAIREIDGKPRGESEWVRYGRFVMTDVAREDEMRKRDYGPKAVDCGVPDYDQLGGDGLRSCVFCRDTSQCDGRCAQAAELDGG